MTIEPLSKQGTRSMRPLKEPLLHFVVLGGLMFAIHSGFGIPRQEAPQQPRIRMTASDVDWLKGLWTRQWHRPPSDEELTGLVADHLKEEVLAQEAKALELDVGDVIVRRRLAQKMDFLLDGTIRTAEPPEAELRMLYDNRPDLVLAPARVSFKQVFFRRGEGDGRARATLAAMSNDSVASEQGDSLLLGDTFADQDEAALETLFGANFAHAVLALPIGRWSTPIESGYGLHLVNVTTVSPPRALPFAEVRTRLAEEWLRHRQETAKGQLLQDLMRKYRVVVDPSVAPWLGSLSGQVEIRP